MPKHHPVYAIVGQSRFLQSEALSKILRTLGDEAEDALPAHFDGKSTDLVSVLDEVRTVSLLSDHRIAVVDDADNFVSENREALEKYCTRPADTGTLILICNSMPKTTRLYKAIQKIGEVVPLSVPKGRAIAGWASQRALAMHGKRLAASDAQRIVEQVGDSLDAIDSELAKLAAYCGERNAISADDISTLTGHNREEKVFAVIDCISNGDPAGALVHWEQVLATNRAAPALAIAGLAWGVRRMLDTRRDFDRGVSVGELSRRMFTDPATLKRRFERCTAQQCEEQQRDLLRADISVKTGAATVAMAVESFIVKHAAQTSQRRKTA